MPAQFTPQVISQLVGEPMRPDYQGVGYSPNQQAGIADSMRQRGAFPGDSSDEGDLLQRLLEVERTRRLSDAQGNAASADAVRRGNAGAWFLPDLKMALGGK